MAAYRNLPELIRINGKWTMEPFTPTQPAFNWDENRGKTSFLYVMHCEGLHKIGMTDNFERRLKDIQNSCPFPVTKVARREVPRGGVAFAEGWAHMHLAEFRVKGEWFNASKKAILETLKLAVTRAHAYDRRCGEWYMENQRKRNTPEGRAKTEAQYARFVNSLTDAQVEQFGLMR